MIVTGCVTNLKSLDVPTPWPATDADATDDDGTAITARALTEAFPLGLLHDGRGAR